MNKRSFFAILSALVVSAGTLGGFSSCNLSKANGNLPAVKDSTALFDYFTYKGNDDFYKENPLPDDESFYNPILPGWYSDPSICTNGEGDYFLVTSTFTYFPGVPIFHSRDLVNWKQVGHVLSRPSQLVNMKGQHVSGGIFAPAISYNPHNKTYYMVTTNVGAGNFFVKTQDPFGEWSDPIMLPEVGGIDPSFFFDEDGKAYIVNNDDAHSVSSSLTQAGFQATKLASTGGFLMSGNTTFLICSEDDKIDEIISIIKDHSHKRKQFVPSAASYGVGSYTSFPVEVFVGGATIFVTNIERFEKV